MKKALKFILGLILILLIGIYFFGAYFYRSYFLPKTIVNGKDLSLTKKSDLYDNYNGIWKDYKINIISRDGKEDLDVSKFDYKDELLPNQDIKQPSFYWFLQSLYKKEYELKHRATYDISKFDQSVDDLKIVKNQNTPPQDAKIVYENNNFKIEDEVLGNTVDVSKLKSSIMKHLKDENKDVNLEKENIYYMPKIKSDDKGLLSLLNEYKSLFKLKIIYNFQDRKETLTGQDLIKLFHRTEDMKLVPDDAKVKNYIKSLALKYDTFKGTRDFNATGIGLVRVQGGIYGWSTEIKKTSEELIKALNERKDKELTPVYRTVAVNRAVNDLGNSYIEVDLARQNAWLYKDGKLILETKIVTGNPGENNATPTGTHKIWSRERDRFLTGDNYRSHVNYWLPITWTGVGLHDASWRSSFGGNIYITGGSHGCINIPPSVMPKLFDNTFVGMPVVIYDSRTQKIS